MGRIWPTGHSLETPGLNKCCVWSCCIYVSRFRDTTIYAASIDRNKLEDLMELLAEVVYQPLLPESEIELAQESIKYELDMLDKKPDPEPMMTELIHEVGVLSIM